MTKKAIRLATSALAGTLAGVASIGSAHAQAAPAAYMTASRYDIAQHVTGQISPDPDGSGPLHFPATRNTYNAAGQLLKTEQGELAAWQDETIAPANWSGFTVYSSITITYDALGRKVMEAAAGSDGVTVSASQFTYDTVGRLQCTALRMNPAVYGSLPASACSLGTQGSQGPDRITKNVYDAAGELVQVRKAVGTSDEKADVTYSYTPDSLQEYTIDANGNRAQFVYDGFDRRTQWIFPSTTRPSGYNNASQATALATAGAINSADYEQYGYDAKGNRTSLRKRDGTTLTYSYDALDRVAVKVVPERTGLATTNTRDVYYGYDLQGHSLSTTFDSASGEGTTNTWDGFGQLVSTTQSMDGTSRSLSYQYDADGNRTRLTYPDGNFVTYNYDGLDRPLLIQRSGAITLASYGYDAAGRRTAFNGGISTAYGYDAAGRLTSLANNPVVNAAYNNSWSLGYNPAGQITQATRSNDLFAWKAGVTVNRSYTTNGRNQYTVAGGTSFGYDVNGNLTSDGSSTFTYDVENRLVNAAGAKSATLRYDPLGRLYEISGSSGMTRFLYDGNELLAEYDGAATLLRRYVHGANGAADDPLAWYEGSSFTGSNERLLRSDWLGSISLVTDTSGSTIVGANSYDEYGVPNCPLVGGAPDCTASGANVGRFQYTGQAWLSELGMYYYKARIYSPTLGRFLQTDPAGYADQTNLYGYVGNDPINRSDSTGLVQECVATSGPGACFDADLTVGDIIVSHKRLKDDLAGVTSKIEFSFTMSGSFIPLGIPDSSVADAAKRVSAPQRGKAPTPCSTAANEPGKISYTGVSGALADVVGLTGSVGRFTNLKTGTTGYYVTAGAGVGEEAAVTVGTGLSPSMSNFLGTSVNVSGALPGVGGSVSLSPGGHYNGSSIGTAAGAGASVTVSGTTIFGCKIGGG